MHLRMMLYGFTIWFVCLGIGTAEISETQNHAKEHLVNIIYANKNKEVYFLCYGVKFQPNYFLTTASCFDRFRNSGRLSIKENTVHISSVQRPDGPSVPAVGVLEHPNYTIMKDQNVKKERRYDIAIVRVAENLDDITTAAVLPDTTPLYGATFCYLMVFKDKIKPDNLIGVRGNVIPTEDCIPNNQKADYLNNSFCVQLYSNPKVTEEYISGAPVKCNDTSTIFGVFSWGYELDREINYLLVTSFASHLDWIVKHQTEEFPLPGSTGTTSVDPVTTKPTPDPGHTTGTTNNPDDDDDGGGGSAGLLPLSLPILLFIAAYVLTY